MSLGVSADDRWVDDLEDLLGLNSSQGPGLETDNRPHRKYNLASFKPIYAVVLAVGLTGVAVELNRRGSSTDVVRKSIGSALPAVVPSSSSRNTGPLVFDNPGANTDVRRDPASSVTAQRDLASPTALPRIAAREKSAGGQPRPSTAQAIASATMLSSSRRTQPIPATMEGSSSAGAGKLSPGPRYSSDETPRSARTAPGTQTVKDIQPRSARPTDSLYPQALASLPQAAPPMMPGSSQDQSSGETFAQEARVPDRANASRQKLARETEAIDALRMLRRQ